MGRSQRGFQLPGSMSCRKQTRSARLQLLLRSGQASPAPRRRRRWSLAAGSLAELVLPPLPAGTLLARPVVAQQHHQAQQQQQVELPGMEAPRVEIKTSMGTFQVEARRLLHSFH